MSLYVYIVRRVLYVVPILLGVSLIIFLLFNVLSPDPASLMLGKHRTVQQIGELRHELGLDRTYFEQYIDIVKSTFTFEFGKSWATQQEISEMIIDGLFPSLIISIPGFVLATCIALVIAMFSAYFRGSRIDKAILLVTVLLMSVSGVSYILLGQYVFAYKLGLFKISGYDPTFPGFILSVLLPILIWIIISIGVDIRFFRTIILDEMNNDYIRTARAKGVNEFKIMLKHVLRNALIPITTYVSMTIPYLVLGSLLIESYFSIPGIGGMTIDAINNADFPVLKAMTVLSAFFYILFNLITDVLHMAIDPRIRLSNKK